MQVECVEHRQQQLQSSYIANIQILNESLFNTDLQIICSGDCCMMRLILYHPQALVAKLTSLFVLPSYLLMLLIIYHIITEKFVSCGSSIKLTHVESGGKYILRSDERQLQSGSGVSKELLMFLCIILICTIT